MEDQRRHTVATSRNGCLKAWSESRGTHGIALAGEDWYDVRCWRLIVTPDRTAKDLETDTHYSKERAINNLQMIDKGLSN